jgi:hypothetical protein
MLNRDSITNSANGATYAKVAGLALVVGLCVGGAVTASADDASKAPVPTTVTGPPVLDGKEVAPMKVLKNGKTAGLWRADTPENQRPDYRPVDLPGGQVGYLKVSEVWPEADPLVFESSEAGRKARVRQMAAQLQANDEGEVWAPAYAEDGVTVIGKVLISTTTPSKE